MGELLAKVIPLALGAAVSPTSFAVVAAILSGAGAVRRGLVFAAGAVVPLLVIGGLVLLLGAAFSLPDSPTAKAVIDLVLGVVLLAIGAHALIRRPKPSKERPSPGEHARGGTARYAPLGMSIMAVNVTTLALFIPAIKLISESGVAAADKGIAAALVVVITMSAVLVPIGLTAVAPQTSARVLKGIGDFFHAHSRPVVILLGLGFGAWLTIRGITSL